eukprot:comp22728_c0_seq1/m.35361 comp22728_c0_seq1/g.35361  ORF comp22728_c0_seq1/g.35361 comp22728_c0_seq1/m.35361 type:complete len:326 (-) comp22728_c0_seq1:116-1093(-)
MSDTMSGRVAGRRVPPASCTAAEKLQYSSSAAYAMAEADTYDMLSQSSAPLKREVKFYKKAGQPFGVVIARVQRRVHVVHVYPDSVAWRVGVQWGDRIDGVGDWDIGAETTAREILRRLRDSTKTVVRITDSPWVRRYVLDPREMAMLGIVYMDGEIREIMSRSAAEKARMHMGESIVGINGSKLLGLSDSEVMNAVSRMFHETRRNSIRRKSTKKLEPGRMSFADDNLPNNRTTTAGNLPKGMRALQAGSGSMSLTSLTAALNEGIDSLWGKKQKKTTAVAQPEEVVGVESDSIEIVCMPPEVAREFQLADLLRVTSALTTVTN